MPLIPPHDICHLDTKHLGKRVWTFPRLESTNTLALCLAQDHSNDGLVLLAQEQSSGRGQYGRVWTAPPGSSVLLSVLIFPPLPLRRPALLTAWAAVAVCETIAEVAELSATIKWPNDVLILGKKVCGILIEQRNTGLADHPLAAAVGIGLNVRQGADFFSQANLPLASSLAIFSGKSLDTMRVAECLVGHLDLSYDRLLQEDAKTLETIWKERLGLIGKRVILELGERCVAGRLLDVTLTEVSIETKGQILTFQPETLRHIEPASV
jgi:BirA family transcriptional regulator, biotin operon repressor / biotin---[acetyl-CoA-carboxylase] ligase